MKMRIGPAPKYALPLSLCLLSGCAADSDLAQTGTIFYRAIFGANSKVVRDQVAAIPYASMGLELGRSPQALLILGTISRTELDWYSGDQLFVATQRGRIIRTTGLPFDLGGLHALPMGPMEPTDSTGTDPLRFTMDFPDLGVFGAPTQCSRKDTGDDSVEIFGASIPTRHIVEHCTVPAMRWRFDNEFWEDRTNGYIWRSSQHVHPKSPPIVLEVLRPEQTGPS